MKLQFRALWEIWFPRLSIKSFIGESRGRGALPSCKVASLGLVWLNGGNIWGYRVTWEVALAYIRVGLHAENSLTLVISRWLHRLLRHRAFRMIPSSSYSMHNFWLLQLLAWGLLVKHLWGDFYFWHDSQVPLRPLFTRQVILCKQLNNLLIALIFTASSSHLEHLWDLDRPICHLPFGIHYGLKIDTCLRFRCNLHLLLSRYLLNLLLHLDVLLLR